MMKLLLGSTAVLAAAMQTAAPPVPPMKMGLWETTATTTTSMPGMQMPSGGGAQPVKVRRCVTPETWARNFENPRAHSACQRTNESSTAGHYSSDFTCPQMNGTGHVEMTFSSPDAGHGKLHMDMSPSGRHIVSDSVIDMRFISASCGDVQPDHPQAVE